MPRFSMESPPMQQGTDEDVRQLRRYLIRLIERLQYTINNLDAENLSLGGVQLDNIAGGAAGVAEAAIAQIGTANIGRQTVQHLRAQVAQIVTAVIRSAVIDWAQIARLEAAVAQIAQAEIGTATIDWAQMETLIGQSAIVARFVGDRMFIDRLGVTSAQIVDLTVSSLCVQASNGEYYLLDVDPETGTVTATQTAPTAAEIAAGVTDTGRHIVTTDITVEELNASTVQAVDALISRLTAARIDVDALFAREAVINAITTGTIAGMLGQSLDLTSNESIRLLTEAIDEIDIGGRNLLTGTSETLVSVTDGTYVLGSYDMSLTSAEAVTFRVYILPEAGARWKAGLRLIPNEASGAATLGVMALGSTALGVPPDGMLVQTADAADSGWVTITARLPMRGMTAQAELTGTGNAAYRWAKMEVGNKPTAWTAAEEDWLGRIGAVEDRTNAALEVLRDAISLRVTQEAYAENHTVLQQQVASLEVRTGDAEDLAQEAKDAAQIIGTHVIIEPQYVRITQDHEQATEMQLTSQEMRFVSGQNTLARFGVEGGYAYRLQSYNRLSVGTDEDGWYDMTAMQAGVADKWRNGTQTRLRALITAGPETQRAALGAAVTFEVTAENATGYQWQARHSAADAWRDLTGETARTLAIAQLTTAELGLRFRCRAEGAGGDSYSDEARVYCTGAPVIARHPADARAGAAVSVRTIGATGYQWEYKTAETDAWAPVSGATAASWTPTSAGYVRCVVTGGSGTAVSEESEVS